MKKFFSVTILICILFFSMSAMKADKAMSKRTWSTVTVSISNGTNYNAYCQIGGTRTNVGATTYTSAQVTPGVYTVVLHTDSPGSHQYLFTGQTTIVNSTGTATFNNVNISGNSSASIY